MASGTRGVMGASPSEPSYIPTKPTMPPRPPPPRPSAGSAPAAPSPISVRQPPPIPNTAPFNISASSDYPSRPQPTVQSPPRLTASSNSIHPSPLNPQTPPRVGSSTNILQTQQPRIPPQPPSIPSPFASGFRASADSIMSNPTPSRPQYNPALLLNRSTVAGVISNRPSPPSPSSLPPRTVPGMVKSASQGNDAVVSPVIPPFSKPSLSINPLQRIPLSQSGKSISNLPERPKPSIASLLNQLEDEAKLPVRRETIGEQPNGFKKNRIATPPSTPPNELATPKRPTRSAKRGDPREKWRGFDRLSTISLLIASTRWDKLSSSTKRRHPQVAPRNSALGDVEEEYDPEPELYRAATMRRNKMIPTYSENSPQGRPPPKPRR